MSIQCPQCYSFPFVNYGAPIENFKCACPDCGVSLRIKNDDAELSFPPVTDNEELMRLYGYKVHMALKLGEYYEGSTLFIVQDGDKFAFVEWAYGSCEGNDELIACDTQEEWDKIYTRRRDSIQWVTLEELKVFLAARDWALTTYYSEDKINDWSRKRLNIPARIVTISEYVLHVVNSILA